MAGILGKEYTFLRSGITATHNKYFLAGEELSITSCAISYAPSFKPFLPLKSDHSRMCSSCEQNSITGKVALICMHDFIFSIYIQLFNLCPEPLGVLLDALCKEQCRINIVVTNGALAKLLKYVVSLSVAAEEAFSVGTLLILSKDDFTGADVHGAEDGVITDLSLFIFHRNHRP